MTEMAREFEIPQERANEARSQSSDRVRRYFDDPQNYLDVRRYIIEVRRECVKEFAKGRDLDWIVDIGCGDGTISIPLLHEKCHLTLVDLSSNMLDRAMSRVSLGLQKNVERIDGEFLDVELRPATYSLVICIGVLAHVESPERVIMKAASLLRPGGALILECTDAENFTNRVTTTVGKIRNFLGQSRNYRTRLNSARDIIGMSRRQGLNLLSTYRYNVVLPLMSKCLSQATLRKIVSWVYGTPSSNRNVWLAKECLFLFQKPPAMDDGKLRS